MRNPRPYRFGVKQISWLAVFALTAFAFTLAAKTPPPVPARPSPMWPPPPELARIAFVQNVSQPSGFGAKVSGFKHFANWVSGAEQGNEHFSRPFGVAVDDAGNLCLTDTGANTVGFFDAAHKRWHRWNSIGKIRFVSPVSVAKQGNVIYVADSGLASVLAFDTAGKLKFRITQPLQRPSAIVVSGGKLCVVDSQLHAVLFFDLNGKLLSQFGKRGLAPGEFNYPSHLATDADGRLYVTDAMNSRVQIFEADGKFISQIGSSGDGPGCFSRPKGVAVDRFGHVYVVDAVFDNIQIFDRNGQLLLNVGQAGSEPGEFWLPNGIAITSDNRIFVTDSYNHRVQELKYLGEQ